ncbi:7-carboxy-7-deazaguanine synthase [bacterium HR39]|nr:7-carboxy-7-deazaguanine synthase [bacterium HR39]
MSPHAAFDRLWIWQEPRIARALAWYRAVATDRLPAKFVIAASVPVDLDPAGADAEALRAALLAGTAALERLRAELRSGRRDDLPPPARPSLLDVAAALAERLASPCLLCRWHCGVERARPDAKPGACRLRWPARVSVAFHHLGEELPIRGVAGSGTVFFASCNMRCAFCQNGDISADCEAGREVGARELATLAFRLRREGCHNVNWVGGEPTLHLHHIAGALRLLGHGFVPDARDLTGVRDLDGDRWSYWEVQPEVGFWRGRFNVPVLWNSNMYLDRRVLDLLRVLVDIWLPDFKFGPGRCAVELARTPRYWETVTGALGTLAEWGEDVLVRHLVMPEHVECCTFPVLDWLAEHMPEVPVNVMDQYHPDMFALPGSPHFLERHRPIARRPWESEIAAAFDHARARGLCWAEVSLEKRRLYA